MTTGSGRQHLIGLYHGSESGHVVVHLNNQVVLIDFQVKAPKQYSLMIDDELCEIHIQQGIDQLSYQCTINQEANTPGNQRRQEEAREERQHWRWVGWYLAGMLVLVLLIAVLRRLLGDT